MSVNFVLDKLCCTPVKISHPLYLSLHQWPWNKQLLPTQGSWDLNVQWPFMVNLNHQSSIQRLGSLHQFLRSGGSVSTKNITVLLGPNLCIHCSQVWRPLVVKDFQCCATIFILNNYVSDYRTRLLKLHILPLSMLYELNDMFFFFLLLLLLLSNPSNKHPAPSPSQITSPSLTTTLDLVHTTN